MLRVNPLYQSRRITAILAPRYAYNYDGPEITNK